MSARTEDEDSRYETVGADAIELDQYAAVTLENGEAIIYDQDNEDAWVQSADTVDIESMA